MTIITLSPCPSCGKSNATMDCYEVLVIDAFGATDYADRYHVHCDEPCIFGPERPTPEEAAAAWNALSERTKLWDAVSIAGRFRVRLLDDGRYCAVQSFATGTMGGFGATPQAAVIALAKEIEGAGKK